MRIAYIFLLAISIQATGQVKNFIHNSSPDKRFSLTVTLKDLGDSNTEWNYWLIDNNGDTSLLTTTVLHDLPAPVAYWDKSSTKLVYEEQTHSEGEIRIYDLIEGKVVFQTRGLIGGHSMEYFDQDRGIVVFLRQLDKLPTKNYELLTLNVKTREIKSICLFTTSGDNITGTPEVQSMDRANKQLTVTFEGPEFEPKKIKVGY